MTGPALSARDPEAGDACESACGCEASPGAGRDDDDDAPERWWQVRDIQLARFDGRNWSRQGALHADGWKIAGCPVNGPQLAAARDSVGAAWFTAAANAGQVGTNGEIPDVNQLRIPVKYLANLLTAGDTAPVVRALERMLAMRAYQRAKHVDGSANQAAIEQVKLRVNQVEEMYRVMAIANYEDRFVIPTSHREYAENAFNVRGGCGFSFGNGCSEGVTETSLFGSEKKRTIPIKAEV